MRAAGEPAVGRGVLRGDAPGAPLPDGEAGLEPPEGTKPEPPPAALLTVDWAWSTGACVGPLAGPRADWVWSITPCAWSITLLTGAGGFVTTL